MRWIGIAIGCLAAAAIVASLMEERVLFLTFLGLLYLLIWRSQYNSIRRYRRILAEGMEAKAEVPVRDASKTLWQRLWVKEHLWVRGVIETEQGMKEVAILGIWDDPPENPLPVRFSRRYPGRAAPDIPGGLKRYSRLMVYCNLVALFLIGGWLLIEIF